MSKPIRILHVVTSMEKGGIENMLMNFYRKIDREKVRFDFLVHAKEKAEFETEIEALGGKIFRLSEERSIKKFFPYMKSLKVFFKGHDEYKIVHSHIDAMSVFPLYAAKKAGVPVRIAHSHTSKSYGKCRFILKNVFKLFINKFCNYSFACSKDAGRYLFGKKAVESGKVTVIKNGIDCNVFAFDKEKRNEMRKKLSFSDDDTVLCHVGRFDKNKNQSFVLEVLNALKKRGVNAKALFLGEGEDLKKVQELSKKLCLENDTVFAGVVSNVFDYLQAADVFVFPSIFEGLPLTLVEAQANGLSVFASSSVTEESNVSKTLQFLPLESGAEFWAKEIQKAMPFERKNNIEKIRKAGFDSAHSAEFMQKFYLEKWCL